MQISNYSYNDSYAFEVCKCRELSAEVCTHMRTVQILGALALPIIESPFSEDLLAV